MLYAWFTAGTFPRRFRAYYSLAEALKRRPRNRPVQLVQLAIHPEPIGERYCDMIPDPGTSAAWIARGRITSNYIDMHSDDPIPEELVTEVA